MQDILEKAKDIQLVIFDVDGVLTDGSLYLGDNGEEYKAFNSKDGHGMAMLAQSSIEIAIITGRVSHVVEHRMSELGIKHLYQGQREKLPAFEDLSAKLGIAPQHVAYVGDDVVDLPIMTRVGFAIAVQDGHALVKRHAHWVTDHPGGHGAARDVCEMLMEAKGILEEAMQHYLA